MSVSPPKISEIPPFKQRKSKDFVQMEQSSQDGSHPEHQLTIGPTGGAEWTRRLKVAESSPIHRSTDCIVSKDLGTSSDSELLKPAPSWTNVALKTELATTSESYLNGEKIKKRCYVILLLFRCECPFSAKSDNRRRTKSGGSCSEKVKTQAETSEECQISCNLFIEAKRKTCKGSRESGKRKG